MTGQKQKIAIIGVGLLGGSLALALKKKKMINLIGWNHRASSRRKAAKLLPVATTFEKAVVGADIIVLCSHSSSIGPVLKQIIPLINPRTLLMDVSSVKGEVVKDAERISGMERYFIPCHPMAGKEKSGPSHASAELYRDRYVFITPLKGNPEHLIQRSKQFWKSIGAIPVVIGAKTHDRNVALTSHLPHLLASALMNVYADVKSKSPSVSQAVGSGFRDFTRIAAGSPAMWSDVVEMNSLELKVFLAGYRRILMALEKKLKKGTGDFWVSFFEKARRERENLK